MSDFNTTNTLDYRVFCELNLFMQAAAAVVGSSVSEAAGQYDEAASVLQRLDMVPVTIGDLNSGANIITTAVAEFIDVRRELEHRRFVSAIRTKMEEFRLNPSNPTLAS